MIFRPVQTRLVWEMLSTFWKILDFLRGYFPVQSVKYVICVNFLGQIATDFELDGPGSNPGGDEIFRTCPDRPRGPSSLLYIGYRVCPGGKVRPGRAADHSPPSSAEVMD